MGNTRDTGYLQNLVTYDASGNIVLPANLTVNGNLLVATQSYVTTQINNLINGAPALLDTLDELAAALGDDANFASTITTSIAGKQTQLNGTGFVKVTGTTVSYDNSTYLTTASASSTYQTIISNPVTGTGEVDTIPKFTATGTIGNSTIRDLTEAVAIGKRVTVDNGASQSINITPGLGGVVNEISTAGTLPLRFITSGSSITFAAGGTTPQITLASSGAVTFASDVNIGGYFLTGIDKGIKFDSSGSSGHPEISVDSSVNLSFKNSAGVNNLVLTNGGVATFIGAINAGGNINVNSDGIFINRSSSGEPFVFFQKNGVNRGSIYGVTGGGLRVFDESDNQVLTITGTRLGISDASPSRKLTVNFGTSVNDGLIVYGSQRQNTVFQSTAEHCFIYIDSHHANTFLPRIHFQRSSTTYGDIGLERASNSDAIGSYAESEMVVGTSTSVPFSLKTNSQRRIRVASGGGVEVFNTLSVSGNLTARNFSKFIKSWAPAGGTGSGTSTTYNWADELAALAGNFDSAGYYRGFIKSGNGAHYYGYHFDILVGSIGYGSNSLQFKVQNVVGANAPWAGGCGFPPFGTVDNTNFTHINNPCGEYLELYITKLGG